MPRTGTQKDGRLARAALRLADGDPLKAAERLQAEAEATANKPGRDGYVARRKRVAAALIASIYGVNSMPRWIQEAIKDEGGGKYCDSDDGHSNGKAENARTGSRETC